MTAIPPKDYFSVREGENKFQFESTDKLSEKTISLKNGRNYKIIGDEKDISYMRKRIASLKTNEFESVESFQAVLNAGTQRKEDTIFEQMLAHSKNSSITQEKTEVSLTKTMTQLKEVMICLNEIDLSPKDNIDKIATNGSRLTEMFNLLQDIKKELQKCIVSSDPAIHPSKKDIAFFNVQVDKYNELAAELQNQFESYLSSDTSMHFPKAIRSPIADEVIDINGTPIHFKLSGEAKGNPTVILEAGLGSWSLDWSLVEKDLIKEGQVLSYDRSGMGLSKPSKQRMAETKKLSAEEWIQSRLDDLDKLIEKLGDRITKPCVLVGHSMGGLLIQLYARQHPEKVAGLVIVDAPPEALTLKEHPPFSIVSEASVLHDLEIHAFGDGITKRLTAQNPYSKYLGESAGDSTEWTFAHDYFGASQHKDAQSMGTMVYQLQKGDSSAKRVTFPVHVIGSNPPNSKTEMGPYLKHIESLNYNFDSYNKMKSESPKQLLVRWGGDSKNEKISKDSEHDIHIFHPDLISKAVSELFSELHTKPKESTGL